MVSLPDGVLAGIDSIRLFGNWSFGGSLSSGSVRQTECWWELMWWVCLV